jgi:hypothetical protein
MNNWTVFKYVTNQFKYTSPQFCEGRIAKCWECCSVKYVRNTHGIFAESSSKGNTISQLKMFRMHSDTIFLPQPWPCFHQSLYRFLICSLASGYQHSRRNFLDSQVSCVNHQVSVSPFHAVHSILSTGPTSNSRPVLFACTALNYD